MNRTMAGFDLRGPVTPLRTLIGDLWTSRGLLRMLSRRDFYVRYRRPTFGILWAIGVPLIQGAVLSVVFSRVVRIRTGVNYPTFVMSGILPWVYFSSTLTASATAITTGSAMASKVYFPRSILPLAKVISNFYGLIPGLFMIVATAVFFRVPLGPSLLFFIPAIALMLLLTSSFSLLFAGLHVYFRDVGFIVQAVIQPWFYASAVIFPASLFGTGLLRTLVELNPATGMIAMFRAAVFGIAPSPLSMVSSVASSIVLFGAALAVYRRFDRVFVDLL